MRELKSINYEGAQRGELDSWWIWAKFFSVAMALCLYAGFGFFLFAYVNASMHPTPTPAYASYLKTSAATLPAGSTSNPPPFVGHAITRPSIWRGAAPYFGIAAFVAAISIFSSNGTCNACFLSETPHRNL